MEKSGSTAAVERERVAISASSNLLYTQAPTLKETQKETRSAQSRIAFTEAHADASSSPAEYEATVKNCQPVGLRARKRTHAMSGRDFTRTIK